MWKVCYFSKPAGTGQAKETSVVVLSSNGKLSRNLEHVCFFFPFVLSCPLEWKDS